MRVLLLRFPVYILTIHLKRNPIPGTQQQSDSPRQVRGFLLHFQVTGSIDCYEVVKPTEDSCQ